MHGHMNVKIGMALSELPHNAAIPESCYNAATFLREISTQTPP